MTTKTDYTADIAAFYRDLCPVEGDYGPRPLVPAFLEHWLYTCFPLPAGDPAARNVLDSRSKKQGKSSLAACVALYMAARKRGGEVVIAAADADQAKDRVYRSVRYAVENHPAWSRAKVFRDVVELDNGSIIQAISQDWRGAAGGNYSCVVFDELHAYTYEYMRRLYDELVIPPSIKAGVRWISSYAGYSGESVLLEEVWNLARAGERVPGDLPVYQNTDASLLALIDQGPQSWRMPWTTAAFMAEIEASERPNTYRRLWLNEWVSGEAAFLPEGAWEGCRHEDVVPLTWGDGRTVIFGLDASTSRDFTALVGVVDSETAADTAEVVYVKVWKPERGDLRRGAPTIDLNLVEAEILRLYEAGNVGAVLYDPYQLHQLASNLERAGLRMVECPQTSGRIEADQALYDAIVSKKIRHYGNAVLDEHMKNAIAVESVRGWRIAKERTSRKIDAAVALSMAHYGVFDQRNTWLIS